MTKFTRLMFKNLWRSRRRTVLTSFRCGVAVYFCSAGELPTLPPDAPLIQPLRSHPLPHQDGLVSSAIATSPKLPRFPMSLPFSAP